METYVTTKGQIVIPAPVRRKLGIKNGTRIHVDVDKSGQRIILTPITKEYIHSLRGIMKDTNVMEVFMQMRKEERERED